LVKKLQINLNTLKPSRLNNFFGKKMLIIYIARYSYRSSVPIRNVIRSVYSYIGPKIFLCNKDNKCQRKYKLGRKGLLRLAVVGCDYCTASVITLVHSNQGNYFKNAENE